MPITDYDPAFEYRGVNSLYAAELTEDGDTAITYGTPFLLSHVAEVAKKTTTSSETKDYDDQPMIIINSEGSDEVTLTITPPSLITMAKLLGKSFDETTGMMVGSSAVQRYFALLYRTKGTDGFYRYVTRLKGTFAPPDETNHTITSGTDSNNMSLVFTGIYTTHKFTKGQYNATTTTWSTASAKDVVVDERYALADVSKWFTIVQTPDSVTAKV